MVIFIHNLFFLLNGKSNDVHSYESLCTNCITVCCTDHISPLVLPEELISISTITNKPVKDFGEEIILNDEKFHLLKEKKGSTECVFYDSENKMCSIYENRPFDCRLFPFDIAQIDGKSMWILFVCKGQKNSDWSWTEKNLLDFESHDIFSDIISNIENFGNNKTIHQHPYNKTLAESSFVVLREVKIPSKIICTENISKIKKS